MNELTSTEHSFVEIWIVSDTSVEDAVERESLDQVAVDRLREEPIEDNFTEDAEDASPAEYSITSYGADYPVDALVKRLERNDIFIPPFQRAYIWPLPKASRFIESLLLGLPVPGVFLAKEPDTQRLLIIDGQQRLRTLQFFHKGIFGDAGHQFKLRGLKSRFEGYTFNELPDEDRRGLEDYTIHATVIQQDVPEKENTSVYHVFERLNTGGMQLVPQEIRACIYHGRFNTLLAELNKLEAWRQLYGPASKRMRDQELILRFLALYDRHQSYSRPMKGFLNKYMGENRNPGADDLNRLRSVFTNTMETIASSLGRPAFRPRRALNAAVFDSVMFGVAKRLHNDPDPSSEGLKVAFAALIGNKEYLGACESRTTDEHNVELRLSTAQDAFATD